MGCTYRRKICVITGSRAEYGLLCGLLKNIAADPDLLLQLVATGTHLSPEYGLTYQVIENDGFIIDEKLEILLSGDTKTAMAKSLGLAVIGFSELLQRLEPDLLVILGDRYEILAAAQAALFLAIPTAHLSGGECTEGMVDGAVRHAITKMSHLHFVSNEVYRKRVIQLGEDPGRVFNYGDPGLDNLRRVALFTRSELEQELDFELSELNFLVAYHPLTVYNQQADDIQEINELLAALDWFPQACIIITGANADAGGRAINKRLLAYARNNSPRVLYCSSLGQKRYLSALKHCQVLIGNSSSGIVEAPVLNTATVNIGDRQEGRLKAASIIDCPTAPAEIIKSIRLAISPAFQNQLAEVQSLYDDDDTSWKIKEKIKTVNLANLTRKRFYDLDFAY
ncbi:MAG: UDP-N-acetylglucosamine 2-epimerase [Syntrophomonas sp.]